MVTSPRPPLRPTRSSCCSTASTAICSARTVAPSSPRRTSIGSPRNQCGSRTTSLGRCRACRRVTTSSCGQLDFLWKPWGSVELWEDTGRLRAAPLGCGHDARQRPSASVRDRRRELPRRLHGMGVRARPRRRHLEDPPRPELDGRTGVRLLPGRGVPPLARVGSAARRASPARARWPAPRSGSTRTQDGTTGSCSSSTSSIRTSPSTRPTTTPSLYDPDWEGPHLVHPPYMVGAIERGR